MKKPIYFDHNATTPLHPDVLEAMLPYLKGGFGNASSIYRLGQEARKAIDIARNQVAKLLEADPEEIVFTSGGSESINWAIKGVGLGFRDKGRHVVTSNIEHSAGLNSVKYLESMGWQVSRVGVDWHGGVQSKTIKEAIQPDTTLVSVMHANNEIGTIQPIQEISDICQKKEVLFHVDAVQTVGKIPVSVKQLGCDLLSIAAHKINGPKGVGALFIRKGTRLHALIHGGRHERNRRAGTENTLGIVGFGAACDWAMRHLRQNERHVRHLRDKLEKALLKKIPYSRLNGHPTDRLYNVTNLSFEGVDGEGLLIGLDMQGICASSGSACSSGQTEPSHVLLSMGLPIELAKGSIRFSLGWENTEEEVDRVIEVFPSVVERLRNLSPVWSDLQKGIRPSVIERLHHE